MDAVTLSFFNVMSVPRSAFGLLIQFNSYMIISYNTPILTTHIIEMDYSATFTSIAMVGSAIAFMANMPAVLYF